MKYGLIFSFWGFVLDNLKIKRKGQICPPPLVFRGWKGFELEGQPPWPEALPLDAAGYKALRPHYRLALPSLPRLCLLVFEILAAAMNWHRLILPALYTAAIHSAHIPSQVFRQLTSYSPVTSEPPTNFPMEHLPAVYGCICLSVG